MADRPARRPAWRRAIKWAVILAALVLEIVILAPWLGRADLTLADLHWGWLAIAVGVEAVSVVALGALYRPLLHAGGVPMSLKRSAALGAAASAITATVPGGTAVAGGYLYRQFRRDGGSAVLSGWSVGVAGALSLAGFGVVAGTAAAMRSSDSVGDAASTAAIGLAIVLALIVASIAVLRNARPVMRFVRAVCRHLPGARTRVQRCETANIDNTVSQFTVIRPVWQDWSRAFSFAVLNWAADLAAFVLSLHAVGIGSVGLGAAAAAYGAGLATTGLSLLPGGLGTVETGMLLGLTHAGVAGSRAVAGIVTYRLVAYVLVAAVGWVVWAALRTHPLRSAQPAAVD